MLVLVNFTKFFNFAWISGNLFRDKCLTLLMIIFLIYLYQKKIFYHKTNFLKICITENSCLHKLHSIFIIMSIYLRKAIITFFAIKGNLENYILMYLDRKEQNHIGNLKIARHFFILLWGKYIKDIELIWGARDSYKIFKSNICVLEVQKIIVGGIKYKNIIYECNR